MVVLFVLGYTACEKSELIVEILTSEKQEGTRTVANATTVQCTRDEVLEMAVPRLLHCHWGWGKGTGNGNFLAGVFASNKRIIRDPESNGNKEFYYKYDIEQIAEAYH